MLDLHPVPLQAWAPASLRDMASHMKTTVHIPDPLLDKAQKLAEQEGTTLKALIQEGLTRVIADRQNRPAFKLADHSFGGDGLQPEFAGASWEKIRAAIYGLPEE